MEDTFLAVPLPPNPLRALAASQSPPPFQGKLLLVYGLSWKVFYTVPGFFVLYHNYKNCVYPRASNPDV